MNEPKVPGTEDTSASCACGGKWPLGRKEALASAMSFMPNQAARDASAIHGTQMKAAFCVHTPQDGVAVLHNGLRFAAKDAENAGSDHQRAQNCTTDTPQVAQAGIHAQRRTLALLGKKKLMLAMLELKLPRPDRTAAPGSAWWGSWWCCPAPRTRFRWRGSAAGGRDRRPPAPTEHRHHEGIKIRRWRR